MADVAGTCWDSVAVFAAIALPPLGVFMKKSCSLELLISVGLTILGVVPGMVYSVYIVVDAIRTEPSVVYYQAP